MNYGILVLGASISVALFVRICCALDAATLYKNTPAEDRARFGTPEYFNDHLDTFLTGTAEEVYENVLTYTTLISLTEGRPVSDQDIQTVDSIVKGWVEDHKYGQQTIHSRSIFKSQASSPDQFDLNQLCGTVDPPDLTLPGDPGCSDQNGTGECFEDEIPGLPSGCEYDDINNILICLDGDITAVPPLPGVLEMLELNKTQIKTVDDRAFRNVTIKIIRLYDNAITFIHPWAFHDVKNLTSLLIVNNDIQFLSFELYVGLNQTRTINLENNRISFEIYQNCPIRDLDDIVPVLPQLSAMFLSGNPLKIIPQQMFAGLRNSNFLVLYLDNCYLQEIHPDVFTFLPKLITLNLSKNPQLMPTLKSALEGATKLTGLYLVENALVQIPTEALSSISHQLMSLDLSGNYFEAIRREDMSKFSNLINLYLDNCNILTIEENAFEANTKLKTLQLKDNRMRNVFAQFPPTLTLLWLTSSDGVMRMSTNSFQNLTRLENLELKGLQLDKLDTSTFAGTKSLLRLYLASCNIQHIENNTFQHLSRLAFLGLENNPISEITRDTFYGLNRLNRLDVRGCRLRFSTSSEDTTSPASDVSPFQYLEKLNTLILAGNNIVHLSNHLFEGLENLRTIDISNNPIQSWNARLFPHRVNVFNASEGDGDGKNDTLVFTISRGQLQFLTDAMIEDFVEMSQVDLSDNKFICDEGACKLRDMIINSTKNGLYKWLNTERYVCADVNNGTTYQIVSITNDQCVSRSIKDPPPTSSGDFGLSPSSSGTTLIISLTVSLSLIAAVVILLGYKNRAHLRYVFFVAKYKVMESTPRKSNLSTMESSTYEYDVFVSYHREDSPFIEDVFLPEIEKQDVPSVDNFYNNSEEITEAKNHIYTIQNDVLGSGKQNASRFKVCLHERDFEAGVPITENIVESVDSSRKTVIFVSKKYMESQWCSFEMNLAYHRLVEHRRRAFVLVLMEEIPPDMRTKVLNYLMVSKTYLQWPGMNGSDEDKVTFWRRLRSFLKSAD